LYEASLVKQQQQHSNKQTEIKPFTIIYIKKRLLWPNLGVDVIEASLSKLPHGIKVTVII
jgi:hypothetical protein